MFALLKVFDIVPGWVYALALAASVAWGGVNAFQRNLARSGEAAAKVTAKANSDALESARLQVEQNKQRAAQLLADETAKTRATETRLATARATQEKTNAANKTTIESLKTDLSSAAGAAGRLRDPNGGQAGGCGGGGGGASGDPATAAAGGAGDGAKAGGLLSTQLTGLLDRLTLEADTINAAYIACRQDAITVRQ